MWCTIRVIKMAPDAPRGCPTAIAPPSGLSLAWSAPVSASQASGTLANASLTSKAPMSSMVRPARLSTLAVAGIGAVSMVTGSSPVTAPEWKRAGDHDVIMAGDHAGRGEVHRLLARPASAVEGDAGDRLRPAGREDREPADV